MRTIKLPEWNDLPQDVRSALVAEGEFWDAFIGGDMAHGVYIKLRDLLDGLNLEAPPAPDEPPLPDPSREVENLLLGTWDEVLTEITYGLADASKAERLDVLRRITIKLAELIAEEATLPDP